MSKTIWDVIKAPLITEKALRFKEKSVLPIRDSKNKKTIARKNGQLLTFRVDRDASKHAIKAAVESIFKVKVASVRVANIRGHEVRRGRTTGYKPDWKKAYVTLAVGQAVDYTDFV